MFTRNGFNADAVKGAIPSLACPGLLRRFVATGFFPLPQNSQASPSWTVIQLVWCNLGYLGFAPLSGSKIVQIT